MKFEIIEGKERHCGQISRLLRIGHQEIIARLGVNTHRELRLRFDDSAFRKAWMIDGELGALGGVTGPLLAPSGHIWLAVSNKAMRYPIALVREVRRQIDEVCGIKRQLVTSIVDGDAEAKRFAIFLGFVPMDENIDRASSKFGRMILSQKFDATTARVPFGQGFGTLMSYCAGV